MALLFEKKEYLSRLERAKDRMEKAGLQALVVVDPANIYYLTGYDALSYYVVQAVIVALNEPEPIWVGRKMDINNAKFTAWLSPPNVLGWPEDMVQSRVKHPMTFIAEVIRQRGLGNKVIGLEMDADYFNPRSYEELKRNLPEARFEDARLLVSWLRAVKSPAELALMRKAGKIMEKVMQTAIDETEAGVRECDVAAAIMQAQIKGTKDYGGDYTSFPPLIMPGKKGSAPHLAWTDDRFEKETAISFELAACVKRYHSPMSRTVFLGKNPPQKMKETAEVTVAGLNAMLDFIRPGVSCEEVDQVWKRQVGGKVEKDSRTGYAMGIGYPPDWGEHTACFRAGDRTVLQPGMTYHVITGVWMDEGGFEVSEALEVTDKGCATFASFPRKLFTKG